MSNYPKIVLEMDEKGMGKVSVDGHDLSNSVYRVEFLGEVGKPTQTVLYMRACEVRVIGSGSVHIQNLILKPDTLKEATYPTYDAPGAA